MQPAEHREVTESAALPQAFDRRTVLLALAATAVLTPRLGIQESTISHALQFPAPVVASFDPSGGDPGGAILQGLVLPQVPAQGQPESAPSEKPQQDPEARPQSRLSAEDLAAIRREVREELKETVRAEVRKEMEERESANWFGRAIVAFGALVAAVSLWRLTYRSRDDSKPKTDGLNEMYRLPAILTEDPKMIIAQHCEPENGSGTRQLVVDTYRVRRESDIDLEKIIGPYPFAQLIRAAKRCPSVEVFVLDYLDRIPIPWRWIADEFIRGTLGSAGSFKTFFRVAWAKLSGQKQFTRDFICLSLKRFVESSRGEEGTDVYEGRSRKTAHFLIAVLRELCVDETKKDRPELVVRVIPNAQLDLYGDSTIVAAMRADNGDKLDEIDLMARVYEREREHRGKRITKGELKPGHPRFDSPATGYCQPVRLVLRPTEGLPTHPAVIRKIYGTPQAAG